jgi:hypothetical protein
MIYPDRFLPPLVDPEIVLSDIRNAAAVMACSSLAMATEMCPEVFLPLATGTAAVSGIAELGRRAVRYFSYNHF